MRPFLYLYAALLGLSGCVTRSQSPVTGTADAGLRRMPGQTSDYYVDQRAGTAPYSRKLLPDPTNGLGSTNDPNIRVTDIQLTDQYTILHMVFKIDPTRDWSVTSSQISIQPKTKLIAVNKLKSYELIKAEGITLSPDYTEVHPNKEVQFLLYFPRLDKGIEEFNMYECADTAEQTCWNVRGMHVVNP
ncbi:hypothetical protein [Arsenicibacter rosenii]|uniref:Uncharacterized protein n=1 Tax=Arsenicibacter rosenii TaxID=1750698 RepID=A0A1S2VK55_9BACT|nr:hypothetical protein [Arsenicibacter rosenii]OIN59167.1 hypothetical protein BLX24_09210 [Arsenicibacter rosenii]